MTNDELFPEISVQISEKANFKTNVYLKPGADLKTNIGRNLRMVRAFETASLFKLPGETAGCGSWDRVKGYNRVTKEVVECSECPYKKGITISEKDKNGNSKDVEYRCRANFAFAFEHEDDDKQFVLSNVSFNVYRTFMEYKHLLEARGLTVDQVITKVTKIDAPAGMRGNFYEFEFVEELDVNVTDAEQKLLEEIQVSLEKEMTIDYVAGVLNDFAEVRNVEMDLVRAKRLATSISDGQFVYPVKK